MATTVPVAYMACGGAAKEKIEWEEDSTDVGSSVSDAETTCSSVAARPGDVDNSCFASPLRRNSNVAHTSNGRPRRRVPQSLCLGAGEAEKHFDRTVLEPIPGTPVASMGPLLEPMSPQKRKGQANILPTQCETNAEDKSLPLNFRPPPGLLLPPPRATESLVSLPFRAAYGPIVTEAPFGPTVTTSLIPIVDRDSEQGRTSFVLPTSCAPELGFKSLDCIAMPMKVGLAEPLAVRASPLQPHVPAKKRPVFAECCGSSAVKSAEKIEKTLPVKKRITRFLLSEPTHVLPAQMVPR